MLSDSSSGYCYLAKKRSEIDLKILNFGGCSRCSVIFTSTVKSDGKLLFPVNAMRPIVPVIEFRQE